MAWTLSEEQTLALPINSLSVEILRDFDAQQGWNRGNWINESRQYGTARSSEAQRALSEGWAWLEARGLVAWDPSQSSPDARFVTRLGREALEQGSARMEASTRLGMQLHPRLAEKVERQFLVGERELAVFAAMKDVEVRVRELCGADASLVGARLMTEAFNPSKPGVLVDSNAEAGEQVAMMELFRGAIGAFKNSTSHRNVDYEDPIEAAEIVLFADLLHRMLDRVELAIGASQ